MLAFPELLHRLLHLSRLPCQRRSLNWHKRNFQTETFAAHFTILAVLLQFRELEGRRAMFRFHYAPTAYRLAEAVLHMRQRYPTVYHRCSCATVVKKAKLT